MSLKLGELEVDIGADTSDLDRADKHVRKTAKGMGRAFSRLGGIIAAALSFQAVKQTILLADKMTRLDQKIKNVARSAKEFQIVRKGIRDIAKETGGSIESISTLSQQILIAGESLGATSEEVVTMTSNLNKLGTIGGSSATQMGNAMLQFGQSMAGGVVRAEEFNSIVENTPVIAQTIAKGLNVNVGELRKMVIEGRVLSADVFEGLKGQTDEINKKFAAMPLTVDRASGMIANSFAVAIQEIDQGFDVTESIAEAMKTISQIIESDLVPAVDEVVLQFKEMSILWAAVTQDARTATNETLNWGESFRLVKESITFIWKAIVNLPNNIRDVTTIIVGEFNKAWVKTGASFDIFTLSLKNGIVNAFDGAIATMRKTFADFIGGGQNLLAKMVGFFGANDIAEGIRSTADATIKSGAALNKAFEEQKAARLAMLIEETTAILDARDVKIEASNVAISMGLAETDALKKEVASRIATMRKEIKEKRKLTNAVVEDGIKIIKTEKTNYKQQQKNLSDANKTNNGLRTAGLISARTAAKVQIGISAATAISKTAELGFPAAIPFIAMALGTIATARNELTGSGRSQGGSATGDLPIPINEAGSPEMFINNAGRQFLLPDQSGKIVPLNQSGGNGGGSLNVEIINNSSAVVGEPVVTEGRLQIAIEDAVEQAVGRIDGSLASQRGSTFESLRQGSTIGRNL